MLMFSLILFENVIYMIILLLMDLIIIISISNDDNKNNNSFIYLIADSCIGNASFIPNRLK